MTRPVVGTVAEEMYRRMGPVTDQDEVLGWPLLNYIGAFCDTYLQDIDDLSGDHPTYTGCGSIMYPDLAPALQGVDNAFKPWHAVPAGGAHAPR